MEITTDMGVPALDVRFFPLVGVLPPEGVDAAMTVEVVVVVVVVVVAATA